MIDKFIDVELYILSAKTNNIQELWSGSFHQYIGHNKHSGVS